MTRRRARRDVAAHGWADWDGFRRRYKDVFIRWAEPPPRDRSQARYAIMRSEPAPHGHIVWARVSPNPDVPMHRSGGGFYDIPEEGKKAIPWAISAAKLHRQKIERVVAADPRRDPRRTFAAARAELLEHLKTHGWDVKTWGPQGPLKTPHATSPSGRLRLWFKPQAVYYSTGVHHEMGNARSLWIDIRDVSPEEFVRQSSRWDDRRSATDPRRGRRGARR